MSAGESVLHPLALLTFHRSSDCSLSEAFCRLNDREWFGRVVQTGNCYVGWTCEARSRVDKIKQSKHFTSEEPVGCQNRACVSETQINSHREKFCHLEHRAGKVS